MAIEEDFPTFYIILPGISLRLRWHWDPVGFRVIAQPSETTRQHQTLSRRLLISGPQTYNIYERSIKLSIYTYPARESSIRKPTSRCPITNCAATFLKLKRIPPPTGVNHERMSTESSKNVDRLMRASK